MLFQKRFLLPLGFLIAAALSAQQQVTLLNDSFTSATTHVFTTTSVSPTLHIGLGVQNPPASAEWFGIGSNSTESYNHGVGITTDGASSHGAIAYFEAPGAQRQINVGDTLTAAVNFTYDISSPPNTASGFRIGLVNSNSTGSVNNQTTLETGTTGFNGISANPYSGYYAEFDPADSTATTASILYERPAGAATSWVGSNTNFVTLVQQSNNAILPNPQVSGGDTYQALLTLTYTSATVMTFTFDIYDTAGGHSIEVPGYLITGTSGSGSANPTSGIVSAFDGIVFGGASGSLTVTNVTIIHNVAPVGIPVFSSNIGTFTGVGSVTITGPDVETVTITSATSGASIAYTLGSNNTPTVSGGVITNGSALANGGSVTISATTVLKAIAFLPGSSNSSLPTEVKYTITGTTAQPTFSPGTGSYTSALSGPSAVSIVDDTPGATIMYTTDGTPTNLDPPTETNGATIASGSKLTISSTTILQAMAFTGSVGSGVNSVVSTATYTLTPFAPVILDQPPADQPVTLGSTVTFHAAAVGFPGSVTYQWQVSTNGGATWTNLTDTSSGPNQITGSATANLTISSVNTAIGANEYRYVATDSTGPTDSSPFAFFAMQPLFSHPSCIVADSSGNLFVGDKQYNTIQELTPILGYTGDYFVSPVAGLNGSAGSADGTGANALFRQPGGITINSDTETLYVADSANSTIRQIAPGDIVTTLAGSASNQSWQDGTGTAAYFSVPHGITLDLSGNLYVADSQNDVIRKIAPGAIVTTFAGSEGVSGSADTPPAKFSDPFGVAVDTTTGNTFSGNIYVADTGNDTIRAITPAGVVSTLAGSAQNAGSSDGTGTSAGFSGPQGLAVDSAGNIYVADTGNSTIREITPAGVVTTLAGNYSLAGLEDGSGAYALFNGPTAVTVDSQNNVYVADTGNAAIRKITQSAGVVTVTTLELGPAPSPPGGGVPGKTIGQIIPSSVASDGGGGALDGWFLGALAALGILRWRRARR